ncbi:PREDICTED: ABSCISIC ACID-INSENSITIVE 5-like protein 1 [Tarenaya hassleriana]|uniref:ABSCISIC ACID-INSENSITIVE 5-like protein 1 n=1 Tax=Tarenaya hassleriana TaxID=28532 RepID=UPI00053C3F53|nr:PREDICTED: ABSCISIC ACID-INSENSITIVE 5-like protein 1 [Tarenaya hassleriana]XP_010535683.1 PREDICTED: ABSCISIC ACID-INSENSITIVE 5-like protein 1 [Tarenaya hassleriana]
MSVYESDQTSSFHIFNPEPQTQIQTQTLHAGTQPLRPQQLGRQNSILSLTLDEIQTKSGKNFGAMNMDEFLANIWTVEASNVEPASANANATAATSETVPYSVLARQGSLSVPVPLCKKTVDEVWFEIQNNMHHHHQPPSSSDRNNPDEEDEIPRQQTLGEITLEDFLVKAGVVQEPLKTAMVMTATTTGFGNPEFGVGIPAQNPNGYNDNRPVYSVLGESSSGVPGNVSSSGRFLTGLDAFRIKKRIIDGPPEVLMERRQRRMIKNRESAARSRARKQAYTVELELELNQLVEENLKLKKIVEENEKTRRQEVMNRSNQIIREKKGDKLRRIRRMVSTGW